MLHWGKLKSIFHQEIIQMYHFILKQIFVHLFGTIINPVLPLILQWKPIFKLHWKADSGCLVWSVHLFGSVSLLKECHQCFGQDAAVAEVGEPQWLTLSFPGQQYRQLQLSYFWAKDAPDAFFPERPLLPFLDFPVPKASQENCNYSAS